MASSHTFRPGRISPPLLPPPLTPFFIVALFRKKAATKVDARSLSLSLFCFDQFSAPNNGITSSPQVPTQRRLFFDVSPNVDTDYWLSVTSARHTTALAAPKEVFAFLTESGTYVPPTL